MHAATRHHALTAAIAVALALAGAACSQSGSSTSVAKAEYAATDAVAAAAESAPAATLARAPDGGGVEVVKGLANHNGSQLAYAHDIRVRLAADKLAASLGKARDACTAQAFGPCDVLNENLQAGDYPSGDLQMRAAPSAIAGLVKAASEGGTIAQRSTSAEDLAAAVRDNGLRRKRLELQHAKLTEILERGHGDMDQLVGITERLAALEAELGAAEQESAQQQRRIATNLLSLHFEAENVSVATVASSRIGDAFRGLTSTWDTIIAWMVSVILGAVLPFAVVLGAAGWLALKLLRRRQPTPATNP
jgi:hypothetical protein